MELQLLALGILVVIVALAGMLIVFGPLFTEIRRVNSLFRSLAWHVNGMYHVGSFWTEPHLSWQHEGLAVSVSVRQAKRGLPFHFTQFQMETQTDSLRLELRPQHGSSRDLPGVRDIQIGVPLFDAKFLISGNDSARAIPMLSSHAQSLILQLRDVAEQHELTVSIRKERLTVFLRGAITDYSTLVCFVNLCLELSKSLVAGWTPDIQYLASPPKLTLADAICQVCGEPIDSQPVVCRQCDTPHHRDCWEYFGSCSTYGCLGKEFRRG